MSLIGLILNILRTPIVASPENYMLGVGRKCQSVLAISVTGKTPEALEESRGVSVRNVRVCGGYLGFPFLGEDCTEVLTPKY